MEGELRKALKKEGFSENIRVACRTDRGVSALCNIFSSEDETDYCSRLTSRLKDIWIYASCRKKGELRKAIKHYIYFFDGDYNKVSEAASIFCGTHNFSLFSKPENKNPIRTLQVKVESRKDMLLLHFYSQGFLWEMIRRIVGGIKMHCEGKISEGEICIMLEGKERKAIAPASPENLLLTGIETNMNFMNNAYVILEMEKEFFSRLKLYRTKSHMYEEMRTLLAL